MSRQTQTVEKTGKRWKGMMLWGIVGLVAGACILSAQGTQSVLGWVFLCTGAWVFLVSRVGGWWYHG